MKTAMREIKVAGHLLPASILGVSVGVFLHGYWLIDLLPIDSKRLLLATVLTGLLGAAGYAALFYFIEKLSQDISRTQLAGLIGTSVLVGAFLFFAGTDRWQPPTRYFTPLLPGQTLQVSIPDGQNPGDISISWVNNSLGDVSFDAIEYKGWKRENDRLVLTDPAKNSLRWSGKTGETAQITFDVPARRGEAVLAWNGQEEVVPFSGQKTTVVHSFKIPFFASREFVLLLGVINYIILCFPLCLLIWKRRTELQQTIENSLIGLPKHFDAWEWAVIAGSILLAASLRLPNLDNLFPGVDEYYQLIAARQIINGVPMGEVYPRSLWLVTVPASLMFRIFGYELWAARLPGAVMNALAVLPLYLVARRINRPVAVLSVMLYATSPWVITFARIVREYAVYPFLFYLIVYGMVLFLDKVPQRLRLERDFRIFLTPKMFLLTMVFLLLPVYAFYVDITSTFKLILIALAMLGMFALSRMDRGSRVNQWVVLLLAGVALSVAFFWLRQFRVSTGFNPSVLGYFFANPPQQLYFNRVALLPLAGLLGVFVISLKVQRVNFVPLFILSLFSGFLAFFIFSSNDFQGTRHLSTTNLWYIILAAIGLYLVWLFLRTFAVFQRKWSVYLAVAVLGLLGFNFQQSLLPVTDNDPYMSISRDYHHDMTVVHEFMQANVRDGDVLVASVYGLYAQWTGEPVFRDVFRFTTQTPADEFLSLIEQNDSGWIVIDTIRVGDAMFPIFDVLAKDDRVKYVGLFGDEHVWRWQKTGSQP